MFTPAPQHRGSPGDASLCPLQRWLWDMGQVAIQKLVRQPGNGVGETQGFEGEENISLDPLGSLAGSESKLTRTDE